MLSQGTIPLEWGSAGAFPSLQRAHVGGNQLKGSLPDMQSGAMAQLEVTTMPWFESRSCSNDPAEACMCNAILSYIKAGRDAVPPVCRCWGYSGTCCRAAFLPHGLICSQCDLFGSGQAITNSVGQCLLWRPSISARRWTQNVRTLPHSADHACFLVHAQVLTLRFNVTRVGERVPMAMAAKRHPLLRLELS